MQGNPTVAERGEGVGINGAIVNTFDGRWLTPGLAAIGGSAEQEFFSASAADVVDGQQIALRGSTQGGMNVTPDHVGHTNRRLWLGPANNLAAGNKPSY